MTRIKDALGLRGPWQFYFDFVLFPTIAITVIAIDCRSLAWVGLAMCGVLLFSFLEYWVHRIALHEFFYHGTHERHHTHPAEYVVFPIWYTPAFFAGFFFVLPLPIFAGTVIGYIWFLVWHHILHHFDLSGFNLIRRYAVWHLKHHKMDDCNFGITLPIWDFMFGTHKPAN